jgi:hypothetical protein
LCSTHRLKLSLPFVRQDAKEDTTTLASETTAGTQPENTMFAPGRLEASHAEPQPQLGVGAADEAGVTGSGVEVGPARSQRAQAKVVGFERVAPRLRRDQRHLKRVLKAELAADLLAEQEDSIRTQLAEEAERLVGRLADRAAKLEDDKLQRSTIREERQKQRKEREETRRAQAEEYQVRSARNFGHSHSTN